MTDPRMTLWRTFQKLANEYPVCNAVRLTLELQRWFIGIQQEQLCNRLKLLVSRTVEPQSI